ncbi:hypothetical protein CAEBREN_05420 [Caenorhabditis brenneri]|uniref:alpha-L-fucosidase n=1 Tax=Caenorhabditis brenneri TaxID=135651 RepID=G0MGR5_CAEBE|nr:hypothetical protein CAEBREN_05420 [Caenorhabditis brenneri]
MFLLFLLFLPLVNAKYTPDWDSLDKRPLPSWYDDSKFGIFCHWGLYSVPAYRSEWMWWYWKGTQPDANVVNFVEKNYKPGTTYADFAKDFTAEYFDAKQFAETVKSSGARQEKKFYGNKNENSDILFSQQISYPQMIEIVTKYRPEVVWSDGEWDKPEEYWKAKEFLAWLYNSSPVKDQVVVNDRWGTGTMGKHGGFLTYSDHYDPGTLLERKWENCMTLDKHSWGNRRDMKASEVYTAYDIIEQLARTIACNGNLLLNVGPNMHGQIPAIFEDRLAEIGKFVNIASEAVYGTKPWIYQNDTSASNVWYTSRYQSGLSNHVKRNIQHPVFNMQLEKYTIVYAWILDTAHDTFELKSVKTTDRTTVTILGTDVVLTGFGTAESLTIPSSKIDWKKLPRRDVIVLKIENAGSRNRNPLKSSN